MEWRTVPPAHGRLLASNDCHRKELRRSRTSQPLTFPCRLARDDVAKQGHVFWHDRYRMRASVRRAREKAKGTPVVTFANQ